MSHCISEELTVEKDSKNRPDAYFFWLPPACPWHVFLPAEAAGFPETGWSCWLLGLVPFCGDWSSEGALYSCQTLPCVCWLLQQPSRLHQTSLLCPDCCWAQRAAGGTREMQWLGSQGRSLLLRVTRWGRGE